MVNMLERVIMLPRQTPTALAIFALLDLNDALLYKMQPHIERPTTVRDASRYMSAKKMFMLFPLRCILLPRGKKSFCICAIMDAT